MRTCELGDCRGRDLPWSLMKTLFICRVKVVGVNQYLVKPRVADINENVLSEQLVTQTALTEDLVKSGQPLETAIHQVGCFLTLARWPPPMQAGSESVVGAVRPVREGDVPHRLASAVAAPRD